MMLPRRVPFIGAVPLPMISRWPRSLTSATSTQTFDVPRSRATTYFSSVLGMRCLLIRNLRALRRHDCRAAGGDGMNGFENDAIGETQIGVFDGAAAETLRIGDRVKRSPLLGQTRGVCVNDCSEFAIEQRKAVRRQRTHFGNPRVEKRI